MTPNSPGYHPRSPTSSCVEPTATAATGPYVSGGARSNISARDVTETHLSFAPRPGDPNSECPCGESSYRLRSRRRPMSSPYRTPGHERGRTSRQDVLPHRTTVRAVADALCLGRPHPTSPHCGTRYPRRRDRLRPIRCPATGADGPKRNQRRTGRRAFPGTSPSAVVPISSGLDGSRAQWRAATGRHARRKFELATARTLRSKGCSRLTGSSPRDNLSRRPEGRGRPGFRREERE